MPQTKSSKENSSKNLKKDVSPGPLKDLSPKEKRMYKHIKANAEKSGRYGKRAKEVAARTVRKYHREKGHTKGK